MNSFILIYVVIIIIVYISTEDPCVEFNKKNFNYNFKCLTFDGNCNCLTCEEGYVLQSAGIQKTCFPRKNITNYKNCLEGTKHTIDNENSYICTKCKEGLTLINYACVERTAPENSEKLYNCSTATGVTGAYTCTKCDNSSLSIVGGTCTDLTMTTDKGCSKATQAEVGYVCSECFEKYTLADQLNCYSWIDRPEFNGCTTGTEDEGCNKCDDGFALEESDENFPNSKYKTRCISTTEPGKESIANCDKLKSLTECEICKTGYYVLDGETVCTNICPENLAKSNCKSCSSTESCSVCKTGYYLSGSFCTDECDISRIDAHWKTCSTSENGKECEEGYYSNDTLCIEKCSPEKLEQHWSTCYKYDQGKECENGYYNISTTECIDTCQSEYLKDDSHCEKCQGLRNCKSCNSNSWKTKINRTSTSFNCTPTVNINKTNGIENLKNCNTLKKPTYNSSFSCLRCNDGYYPFKGKCLEEPKEANFLLNTNFFIFISLILLF